VIIHYQLQQLHALYKSHNLGKQYAVAAFHRNYCTELNFALLKRRALGVDLFALLITSFLEEESFCTSNCKHKNDPLL